MSLVPFGIAKITQVFGGKVLGADVEFLALHDDGTLSLMTIDRGAKTVELTQLSFTVISTAPGGSR